MGGPNMRKMRIQKSRMADGCHLGKIQKSPYLSSGLTAVQTTPCYMQSFWHNTGV